MKRFSKYFFLLCIVSIIAFAVVAISYNFSIVDTINSFAQFISSHLVVYRILTYLYWGSLVGTLSIIVLDKCWLMNDTIVENICIVICIAIIPLNLISIVLLTIFGVFWNTTLICIVGLALLICACAAYYVHRTDAPSPVCEITAILAIIVYIAFLGSSIFQFVKYNGLDELPIVTVQEELISDDEKKISAILDVADDYKAHGDLDRAIAEINAGVSVFPNSESLATQLEEYQNEKAASEYAANTTVIEDEAR